MVLWNFSIEDTSPYLIYDPYVDVPSLTAGWRTWYTDSHYGTIPDNIGRGDSYHTSVGNATVTFQFYGSGISLFGTSNTTFEVIIDKTSRGPMSASSPLLYSEFSLGEGLHSVTLHTNSSTLNASQLAFNSALVSTVVPSDQNPPSPLYYDNSNTASLKFLGDWTTETVGGVPNGTVSAPFKQTVNENASVSLSFVGGTAVVVRGMSGMANGIYSVTMDGSTSTFNGSSTWIVPDALLFFRAGLDPISTHHINITNMSDRRLCLNSITVYQHEPKVRGSFDPSRKPTPPPRSPPNIGIIIGPILGFLVLVAVAVFMWHRRRRRSKIKAEATWVYAPRPFPGSRRKNETPSLGVPERIFPAQGGGSSVSSTVNGLTPKMKDVNYHNQKHGHSVSMKDLASNASSSTPLSQESFYSASPTRMSHYSMTFVDSSPTRSEFDKPHSGPSASHASIGPDSVPLSPRRKPLPVVPVPSYDIALQSAQLMPEDVKSMYEAPPQYER